MPEFLSSQLLPQILCMSSSVQMHIFCFMYTWCHSEETYQKMLHKHMPGLLMGTQVDVACSVLQQSSRAQAHAGAC